VALIRVNERVQRWAVRGISVLMIFPTGANCLQIITAS
jgi:hypothetical protein